MDCNWDADFREYERRNRSTYSEQEMIVPDLAAMTDEEFAKRIASMKLEHRKTLELCDSLGLHPASTSDSSPAKPSLPVAAVTNDYMLTTGNYCSPAGDLITTSSRDIRRPFKARRAPPRRRTEHDELTMRVSAKRKAANANTSSLGGEEPMKSYMMERYLSTLNDNDTFDEICWSDNEPQVSRRLNGRPMPRPNSFDNSWRTRVTVPKPFDMTIREELKPRVLSRSMADFERFCDEQTKKEMQACSKKFKASPAPANIYVPLFEELSKDRERRRQLNLAKRQKELDDLQKPFAFLRREDERLARKHRRQAMFEKSASSAPDANFKAKPFPEHIYNSDAQEMIRQQELVRQEEKLNRAEAMLQLSSLPPNMKKERLKHNCEMSHEVDDGRCRSPTRSATRSPVQRCKSPLHHCTHTEDRTVRCERYEEEQLARNDGRAVKSVVERWPRHSLRSSSLSRSLSDLLSASEEDDYAALTVQGYQGYAARSAVEKSSRMHTIDSRNRSVASQPARSTQITQSTRTVKSSNARPTSAVSCRSPVPKARQSTAAGNKVRKWRANNEFTLEDRLRREIEEDLKNIDLTVN